MKYFCNCKKYCESRQQEVHQSTYHQHVPYQAENQALQNYLAAWNPQDNQPQALKDAGQVLEPACCEANEEVSPNLLFFLLVEFSFIRTIS